MFYLNILIERMYISYKGFIHFNNVLNLVVAVEKLEVSEHTLSI